MDLLRLTLSIFLLSFGAAAFALWHFPRQARDIRDRSAHLLRAQKPGP